MDKIEKLEARIIRLEESLWFLEQNLKELDELTGQLQKRQDALIRQIGQTRQLVLNMRDILESQIQDNSRIEVPPHYQQQK